MYKYLFGPVPSRRLGMSLGVDLVPHKVCTLDCVYCECGATTKLTVDRKEYILYDKVTKELKDFFTHNPDPDYITFSGSGEPTLNSRIGDVLNFIKKLKPNIPVAVLTNGTLLHREDVRQEIMNADVVLPSLDAALQQSFNKINRPFQSLNIQEYIQGVADFSKEFKGEIWLEILIIPEFNDSKEDLAKLKTAIRKIHPNKVQLNTLDRPGTVSGLMPADREQLKKIVDYWNFDNVEIIASVPERKEVKSYRDDIETAILETIARRPCTLDDLNKILGIHINEINKYLGVLEDKNKIINVQLERGIFYKIISD
ncbi:MAG: radical SAM protein [Bacteroidetes bacterium]|nr:MAG: radical SAM protein [Bacteroidota bacterium]